MPPVFGDFGARWLVLGAWFLELGTLNLGSWQNLSPLDRKCDLDVTKMSKEIDRTMKARPRVAAVIQRYGPEVLEGKVCVARL